MALHNRKYLKTRRRRLRNNPTPAEAELWKYLKQRRLRGRKFRRQHSIGPFIPDFYCPAERLAVELDGAVHDIPAQAAYDAERTQYLVEMGIRVIRFRNEEVFDDVGRVLDCIAGCFGEG